MISRISFFFLLIAVLFAQSTPNVFAATAPIQCPVSGTVGYGEIEPAVIFIIPSGWKMNSSISVITPEGVTMSTFPNIPTLISRLSGGTQLDRKSGEYLFSDNTVRSADGRLLRDNTAEGKPAISIGNGKTSNDVKRNTNGTPLVMGAEFVYEQAGIPAGIVSAFTKLGLSSFSFLGNCLPVNAELRTAYPSATATPVPTTPKTPNTPVTPIVPPKPAVETGGSSCLVLTAPILEGSSGSEVIALQDFLRTQGFFTANSTGFFGPITAKSVSAFQEANGLESVGSVGPKTRAKIQSISCGTNSSVVSTPINTGSGSTNTTGTVGSGIQVTIKAKPPMATTGLTSTLVWSAPNALSCTASGAWSGPRGPVGEQIIGPLYSAGKYELTCRSETASGYASVQVSVQAGDAPTTGTTVTPVTNTNTGSANTNTNTNTNTGSTNTSSGAIGSNTPVVNGVADLKISTDGVNFTDGPISFAYRDRLWFKWTSTISGNACSVPTPPESGGVINTFMGSNFANYTFGPVSAGTNGFPYSADALSIRYNLVCNRGIYDGNVVLADYVVANFVGQNPVSNAIASECTNLFIGNPTVNGPTPGYPWGTMYMSGNPRWREIEWRIQNGITLLPSDLGKYYTEYMTAMGLTQNLRNLLRPDGTPFAGPGGLVIPQNASVTNSVMFPTYNRSSGVFDYQANIGFVGSQQGASTEAWFSPFSSATRVACPLVTPLN